MTLNLMLGVASGVLHPAQGCKILVIMFQPEDPDVILLKKARQEKKVKRYLEDNFQNRQGRPFTS